MWADIVTATPGTPDEEARPLQVRAVQAGEVVQDPPLDRTRSFHAGVRSLVGTATPLALDRRGS